MADWKKLLNFDTTVHKVVDPGTFFEYRKSYTVETRNGVARVAANVKNILEYDGVELVRDQDGNNKLSVGDIVSFNGIKFLVVNVEDFERVLTMSPLKFATAPIAAALYLKHQWKHEVYFKYMRWLMEHRLLVKVDASVSPSFRDYFFTRDSEISRLRKELFETVALLEMTNKELEETIDDLDLAEARNAKFEMVLGSIRDVANEHL